MFVCMPHRRAVCNDFSAAVPHILQTVFGALFLSLFLSSNWSFLCVCVVDCFSLLGWALTLCGCVDRLAKPLQLLLSMATRIVFLFFVSFPSAGHPGHVRKRIALPQLKLAVLLIYLQELPFQEFCLVHNRKPFRVCAYVCVDCVVFV